MKFSILVSVFIAVMAQSSFAEEKNIESKGIDKESIRGTVKQSLPGMKKCYETALTNADSKSKLDGKIVMSWEIASTGKPQKIVFKSDDIGSEELQTCMKENLQKLEFAKPPEGQTAVVEAYPFIFAKNKTVK